MEQLTSDRHRRPYDEEWRNVHHNNDDGNLDFRHTYDENSFHPHDNADGDCCLPGAVTVDLLHRFCRPRAYQTAQRQYQFLIKYEKMATVEKKPVAGKKLAGHWFFTTVVTFLYDQRTEHMR